MIAPPPHQSPRIVILEDDVCRATCMRELLLALKPLAEIQILGSAFEFCDLLSSLSNSVDLISLDHDLNPAPNSNTDPGDGLAAAECLTRFRHRPPVIVHTSNLAAGDKMIQLLSQSGFQTKRVFPYDDLLWIRESWSDAVRMLLNPKHG